MIENSESSAPPIGNASQNPAPQAASSRKNSTVRKPAFSKKELGKTVFRLPIALDRALRLASVLLEEAGEEIHTPTQMVEHAVKSYIEFLQTKKRMDFQGIVPPKSVPPTKPA